MQHDGSILKDRALTRQMALERTYGLSPMQKRPDKPRPSPILDLFYRERNPLCSALFRPTEPAALDGVRRIQVRLMIMSVSEGNHLVLCPNGRG